MSKLPVTRVRPANVKPPPLPPSKNELDRLLETRGICQVCLGRRKLARQNCLACDGVGTVTLDEAIARRDRTFPPMTFEEILDWLAGLMDEYKKRI